MKRGWFVTLVAMLGFLFLYAPIISLVVFSFNENKLVTVWGGFSTKWYAQLFADPQILTAGLLSLQIAAISASIALVTGTLCGVALTRFRRFRGKTLLAGLVSAPLVMPDVITGLSLLLLFVAMESIFGWPAGRGELTIVFAHATFCMAYVTVVVRSRLSDLDLSLEEAAQDLGAIPARVFFDITLPIIAPALISGWLLSFTLSLDDLVIASFVSGPDSNTLPMVIFSKMKLGVSPDINALASLIIGVVALGVITAVAAAIAIPGVTALAFASKLGKTFIDLFRDKKEIAAEKKARFDKKYLRDYKALSEADKASVLKLMTDDFAADFKKMVERTVEKSQQAALPQSGSNLKR